jgi:pectinesterase
MHRYILIKLTEHEHIYMHDVRTGRDQDNMPSGLVIQNCQIKAARDLNTATTKSFLGRPWKLYSRTVVMESFIDSLIHPEGWLRWDKEAPTDKLYYAEYANRGPGSPTAARVMWKGYQRNFGRQQALQFTAGRFIQLYKWVRKGIPNYTGFT